MVEVEHVLVKLGHRLAVDFHDDAERRFVGIHPVQRETFLDVKFVGRVVVKNDLAQQAVDFHDRHLAGNLHAAVLDVNFFAGLELAELLAAGDILFV